MDIIDNNSTPSPNIPNLDIIPEEAASFSFTPSAKKGARSAAQSGLFTSAPQELPGQADDTLEPPIGEQPYESNDILDRIERGSDDFNKILALRLKVDTYLKHFREELKWHSPTDIEAMTAEELQNTCEKFDIVIGASSAVVSSKRTINSSIYALETVLAHLDYDCSGATATLLKDEVFQKSVLHMAVKSGDYNNAKPEITVPLTIATTFLQTFANNSAKKEAMVAAAAAQAPKPAPQQAQAPKQALPPPQIENINAEYNDL